MSDAKVGKSSNYFECELCDYITSKKYNFEKHMNTSKHLSQSQKNVQVTQEVTLKVAETKNKAYTCEICDKEYQSRNGLWVHRKICRQVKTANIENDDNSILIELVKQNQDFQKFMMEQNKIILELAKNSGNNNNNTINNNSHNKTFNLNMFLNEKCKDAMNIDEFVDSLKLTFTDLESVGELGFVKGISRIFINGLRELDIYKRPIHCSDLKREVIHLKEDGVWLKDNENKDSMKKLVKMIANKNINKIYEWKVAYPSHRYSDDPKNDIYLKFLCESMGAKTREGDILFYEKVIKNVAKEITIDKNNN